MKKLKKPAPHQPINRRSTRRKGLSPLDVAAFSLLLFFAVLAGISIKDYVAWRLLDFAQPVWGSLADQFPVSILVIRDETLVKADKDGDFRAACQEGERVKEGAVIGYLEAFKNGQDTKTAVLAPQTGIVHYLLDGYEGLLSGRPFDELSLDRLFDELESYSAPAPAAQPALTEGKGHYVAKIIDNLIDYRVVLVYEGGDIFPDNGSISFKLPDSGELVTGRITDKLVTAAAVYLTAEFSSGTPYLSENRFFSAEAVLSQYYGLIIPAAAITENASGEAGVYKNVSGRLVFCPVAVEGTVGYRSAVKGLAPTDEILSEPRSVQEGQKIYD